MIIIVNLTFSIVKFKARPFALTQYYAVHGAELFAQLVLQYQYTSYSVIASKTIATIDPALLISRIYCAPVSCMPPSPALARPGGRTHGPTGESWPDCCR